MSVIGSISDTQLHPDNYGPPVEAGTLYELHECPYCNGKVLVAGHWHDMMEDPEEWIPTVVLPEAQDREARAQLAARLTDIDCMKLAIAEARKCVPEPGKVTPRVGAVVALPDSSRIAAFRGEYKPGEHAEFTLLQRKCPDATLAGSTVYTTLEPCTSRNHPKIPCADRLVQRKVNRVVIGILDPDERIRGLGSLTLRKANIQVDLFPPELMTELEELNRDFIISKSTEGPRNASAKASSSGEDKS